ncbi:MAG: maltose alpha-D-glucosyltransferase / alpha-amylase, partial [Frankiales bacterium]|nr:maltose alpha-D-glucosyltransferase / alpha-amylase [Frankiales bacterium]
MTVDPLVSPEESRDPLWFKRAVFYEVLVRGFADSNGDGTGDIPGLISKLDYLQWLGIDCIWLLPIYQSPLRDNGYDISDYLSVLPEFGDLGDFVQLVEEAHQRGMRIIADLVMNHSSDAHPWFQASRSEPDGPYGDYYVWSDSDELYPEARIIFVDTEKSNWTWDPVRGQFYWHRFFSHQPDLNYDNPALQTEMIEVLKFWLDLGIDGFRLDAVPYLYVREGTNGENLPETHDFLKRVRKEVDELYPDRVMLCEANQWPQDVVEYFGADGDECQMAFHFPLMPRLFMAVRRESRYPITEILAQTPEIPKNCQWGIFLRNHDELTLEMVTDEERDYMYTEYAKDPRMKSNIGIARRLAPLLENSRDQIELFTGLLLSLPGSPVLYYGDEIGMGDNIYLGDRDGVRTPMQWSADRNAGFSEANPQRLFLPIIIDPEYHYEANNVATQQGNAHSLLWWMKRLIAMRRRYRAFGRGGLTFLQPENRKVLAFVRQLGEERILV